MRIKHLSITAKSPQKAAENLAELSGGIAEPFLSKTMNGAWLCTWHDNEFIEFIPDIYRLDYGEYAAEYNPQNQAQNFNASHVMLETQKSVEWLKTIADKHNLVHRFRPRFGGPLYEVWLEEQLLIEFCSNQIKPLHIGKPD